MLNQYVSVGIGCFLGGCLRYFISKKLNTKFPIGTLGANVVGAFLIGFFFYSLPIKDTLLYLFLTTGFCGGLTTFSTFNLEILNRLINRAFSSAFYYWLIGFFSTLIAVDLGGLVASLIK